MISYYNLLPCLMRLSGASACHSPWICDLGLWLRPKDQTLFWEKKSHREPNPTSGSWICYWEWKTVMFPMSCKQVHCHFGVPNCHHGRFSLSAPIVLPQMNQNVTVGLLINSLTLGREFTVHQTLNIKGNHQHALGSAPDLTHLLWS